MKTVAEIVAELQKEISAERQRAALHVAVGDNEGAVHHKSKAQVLEALLVFIDAKGP